MELIFKRRRKWFINIVWNKNSIGYYNFALIDDNNNVVCTMWLRDYTCDYYKENPKPRGYDEDGIKFEFEFCDGYLHNEKITDKLAEIPLL